MTNSPYTIGGTVQAGGGIYITRRADDELLQLCRDRTFAYILTPRQMGKSSLMVQTAQRLSEEGVRTVVIDLTQIGTQVGANGWYLGLLTIFEDQLMLDTDVLEWWEARQHLGVTQRLTRFVEEVLLTELAEPVVVFVDEIDTTLGLDFTDDFFIAIRYFYVNRAQNAAFERLSFVLIGVATPGDLIRDPQRTPFNVGQRIDLTDFTPEEARPLAAGLGVDEGQSDEVLGWVLGWTGGHPYLTQRLCAEVARYGGDVEAIGFTLSSSPTSFGHATRKLRVRTGASPLNKRGLRGGTQNAKLSSSDIDAIVARTFFGVKSEQDNNLQFVRDMLTKQTPAGYETEVLETYRAVWRGRRAVVDEEQSIAKSHLKLSGVVRREGKRLSVRNRIYREVFGWPWIQDHLPETLWQRWRPAMPVIAGLTAVAFVMGGLAVYTFEQQNIAEGALVQAEEQERIAKEQEKLAKEALAQANEQKAIAEEALAQAKAQEVIAEEALAQVEALDQVSQKPKNGDDTALSQPSGRDTNDTDATVIGVTSEEPKNVRSGIGLDRRVLFEIPVGSRVKILELQYNGDNFPWYKIYTPDADREGWIAGHLIQED